MIILSMSRDRFAPRERGSKLEWEVHERRGFHGSNNSVSTSEEHSYDVPSGDGIVYTTLFSTLHEKTRCMAPSLPAVGRSIIS